MKAGEGYSIRFLIESLVVFCGRRRRRIFPGGRQFGYVSILWSALSLLMEENFKRSIRWVHNEMGRTHPVLNYRRL